MHAWDQHSAPELMEAAFRLSWSYTSQSAAVWGDPDQPPI
jgi:hypothetical protein